MDKTLDRETLGRVARLAALPFDMENHEQTAEDMQRCLSYVEVLSGLDTEGVEPLYHVHDSADILRGDVVINTDETEKILMNAPARSGDLLMVPKTIEMSADEQ